MRVRIVTAPIILSMLLGKFECLRTGVQIHTLVFTFGYHFVHNVYKVLLECLQEPEGATRQERVQFLADAYAAALEAVVRQYPDQWYNFYDFWK